MEKKKNTRCKCAVRGRGEQVSGNVVSFSVINLAIMQPGVLVSIQLYLNNNSRLLCLHTGFRASN